MTRRIQRNILVLFCWAQIVFAALLFLVAAIADLRAPSFGMKWSEPDYVVVNVLDNAAADRSGIVPGDRLVAFNGRTLPSEFPPLATLTSGQAVPLTVSRGGKLIVIDIAARARLGERVESIATGGTAAVDALSATLRLLVNALVLLLAAAILHLRPELGAARVAALTMAYWVGGNNIGAIPGIATLLSPASFIGRVAYLGDGIALALFFSLNLHFGLIFPRPFRFTIGKRLWQLLPYAAGLPLLIPTLSNIARYLWPVYRISVPALPAAKIFILYAPLLLVLELALLAAHFPFTTAVNDRRRLRLVVFSSVPGIAGWFFSIAIATFTSSAPLLATAAAVRWLGALVGAVIFAHALARHRLFDVRPLIRTTIQYTFARGTLLFLALLPAAAFASILYARRNETLQSLVRHDAAILIALTLVLALLVRFRRPILEIVDRKFFRQDYDARQTLVRLASMMQRGNDFTAVARVAVMEIQKALHPKHISLWTRVDDGYFAHALVGAESVPQPPVDCPALAAVLRARGGPVSVDFDDNHHLWRRLPEEERQWLRESRASLVIPLLVAEELMGFIIIGERRSEEPYAPDEIDLLNLVATQLALTERYVRLESIAKRDALTEALNRHAFYSLMEKRRLSPDVGHGCVAVIDINDLKTINDTEGHAVGDLAIRRVAAAIRSVVRADDLVFRWGGDEFLVLLFGLGEEEVEARLDRLGRVLSDDTEGPLTVSHGLAAFVTPELIADAMERADRRMYERKNEFKTASAEG